jgi:hypothetical protein
MTHINSQVTCLDKPSLAGAFPIIQWRLGRLCDSGGLRDFLRGTA